MLSLVKIEGSEVHIECGHVFGRRRVGQLGACGQVESLLVGAQGVGRVAARTQVNTQRGIGRNLCGAIARLPGGFDGPAADCGGAVRLTTGIKAVGHGRKAVKA